MAKKIRIVLTLQLPAGKATPAPPVGTALGPHGINIVEFTKSYNEKTADKAGQIIPAQITIFEDRSFTFILKTPPAADLLRKAAGDREGLRDGRSARPSAGSSRDQVRQIAEIKMADLNANDIEAAMQQIEGTARSHGHRGRRLATSADHARGSTPAATVRPTGGGRHAGRRKERDMAHGKKYLEAAKLVDRERIYTPAEAAALAKETTFVTFDATVEAHLRLGVDPRHADQMVRGTVVLPHGTGKVVRVAVFAQGDKAQEALRAGADEVGGEDLVKKIEAGWLEFDVALATPDSMGMVGKLGKILGRRGLMPNPKAGTITFDLDRAIREVKGGRVEFKVDKAGIIHAAVRQGRASRPTRSSPTSPPSSTRSTGRSRPARRASTCSGLTIASTMGPGIRVDLPARPRRGARGLHRRPDRLTTRRRPRSRAPARRHN